MSYSNSAHQKLEFISGLIKIFQWKNTTYTYYIYNIYIIYYNTYNIYRTSCSFCNDMVVYLCFVSLADTYYQYITSHAQRM